MMKSRINLFVALMLAMLDVSSAGHMEARPDEMVGKGGMKGTTGTGDSKKIPKTDAPSGSSLPSDVPSDMPSIAPSPLLSPIPKGVMGGGKLKGGKKGMKGKKGKIGEKMKDDKSRKGGFKDD